MKRLDFLLNLLFTTIPIFALLQVPLNSGKTSLIVLQKYLVTVTILTCSNHGMQPYDILNVECKEALFGILLWGRFYV